jgi:V/A-type H+-transporting ATPase subunit E
VAANKIIEKIQQEAKDNAAGIRSAAEQKAANIKAKIMADAQEQIKGINNAATIEADEAGRRQVLIAELDTRKKSLGSKRDVIEKAFAGAEEALAKLPEDKWQELITNIVVGASTTGTEKLQVPSQDADKYKNGFLAKLNEALTKAGKKGELTLSDKPAAFKGGVMLIGKTSDYDGSFATLLQDIRTREEKNVADILFGTEVK